MHTSVGLFLYCLKKKNLKRTPKAAVTVHGINTYRCSLISTKILYFSYTEVLCGVFFHRKVYSYLNKNISYRFLPSVRCAVLNIIDWTFLLL